MFIRTILCFISMLASSPVIADEMTLARAIELSLAHAPAMQAARAGRDVAKEELTIGQAGLLPRVDLSGSYQTLDQKVNYDTNQNTFQPDYKSHDSRVTLRAVQPLFDLERWAGYRQGAVSAESGEMRLRLERQRLMLEVSQVYLEAVTAAASLEAARARERAAERLAEQAKALFEGGVAAVNDSLDAGARRDMAVADRLAAENELDQALATLSSLTGIDGLGDAITISPPVISDVTNRHNIPVTQWEESAAQSALTVRLARLQFRVAEEENLKAVGSQLPKVEAFASIQGGQSSSGQLGIGSRTRDRAVGLQVSMPIFAGGGDFARYRKSRKAALQAEFSLQDDIRLARLTARQAYLGYSASISQLQAMRRAVTSSKEASNAARAGHEVGLRTMSEVLDADERYFEAEKNLAGAEAQFVFAELQLKSSVGTLDSEPLPEEFGMGKVLDQVSLR